MSDDESSGVRLKIDNDAYGLLRDYARESKIYSKAYHTSEVYFRNMWKCFQYPVVVLSAISSVCAGLDVNRYALLGLSLLSLTLLGFNQLINPREKEFTAHTFSIEYAEIAGSIKQFYLSNSRSRDEIKSYSEQMYALLTKWQTMRPSLRDKFLNEARQRYAKKTRSHNVTIPNLTPRGSAEHGEQKNYNAIGNYVVSDGSKIRPIAKPLT